ncbi:3-deoxy-D-manno-octulosonic acid transferase [Roseomonas sp. GC11]|uniref:3-deoxy-D-manno-octulosonic acid transferase n=1 Tax=Roseomonas sp. GC11 TaxID=2950546 RepID=UPI00210B1AD1|nr:glycosyltransferase N-terminal domain-containing protein [Roseomonas sp. GC11]MCQ4162948.1 3-deoxy-D-manno-octulosonic acid transferase [Roseomonas sp. GC11]
MSLGAGAGRLLGVALGPLLPFWLRRRARIGKELPDRLAERQGWHAERPPGALLWLHAASVGETMSLLPLIGALLEQRPGLRLLVTTGTVTAATMLAQRLPPEASGRVTHRFAPLDVPRWLARFLDGWRPDGAIFVESELWPNLSTALARRGIPAVLVNARISPRSARLWRWAPGLIGQMLGRFRLVVAQSAEDAERLRALGAARVEHWGHLKAAAAPLPADPAELARLRGLIGARPVFLAASTHAGEEAAALEAHRILRNRFPDLLTLIAPRHPARAAEVAALAAPYGGVTRRSAGGQPDAGCDIHIADTLGEMGLFFRLAGVALLGATLVPKGGHNPIEPARLGCPLLIGPHTGHVQALAARLLESGGALPVRDAATLAEAVADVLSDTRRAQAMARAAASVAEDASHLPGKLASAILDIMPAEAGPAPETDGPREKDRS